jgi:hypothetical protein
LTQIRIKKILREYRESREKYEAGAKAYWSQVAEKIRSRTAKRQNQEPITLEDYVLTQPPVYSGPAKPVAPSSSQDEVPPVEKYVPVKADFLSNAAQHFSLSRNRPRRKFSTSALTPRLAFPRKSYPRKR